VKPLGIPGGTPHFSWSIRRTRRTVVAVSVAVVAALSVPAPASADGRDGHDRHHRGHKALTAIGPTADQRLVATANRLRVISDTGQNLRHNIDDGAAPLGTTADGTLTNPTTPPSTAWA